MSDRIQRITVMFGEEWSTDTYETIQLSQEAYEELQYTGGNAAKAKEADEGEPCRTVYYIHHGETWSVDEPVSLLITEEEMEELVEGGIPRRCLEDYDERVK